MLVRLFTEHPASVGESYCGHLLQAMSFALLLLAGALACAAHALLPFLFQRTGSGIIRRLHDRMVLHRRRRPHVQGHGPEIFDWVI